MNDIPINPAHLIILTGLLNGLGAAIKAIPAIKNYLIPFLLAAAGAISHAVLAGWTGQNLIMGIVAGWVAVGLHQTGRSFVEAKKDNPGPPTVLLALCLFLFTGCATYTTVQRDVSPERTIETRVSVSTFWDSGSNLANSKATQTDKSQSASLGSLAQESSSTNVLAELQQVALILKLLRPTP
jgi:hypothetical protein